jgi:hypothetical protein
MLSDDGFNVEKVSIPNNNAGVRACVFPIKNA